MKSERRHELQTNDFADWLGHQLEQHRSHLKTAGIALAALLVVGIVYTVVSQRQASANGASWAAYFQAFWMRDADDVATALDKVAKSRESELAGLWARLTEADIDLENGVRQLYRDRDEALRALERAEENFAAVEKKAVAYPAVLLKARYGLAQALESQGKVEKAREMYDSVAKSDPTGSIGKAADRRRKLLMGDQVAEFYDWFQRQTPQPLGKPGGAGLRPLGLDDQPDRPDLSFGPGLGGGSKPSAGPPVNEPAEDKPAEDKPESGEKPETGEKPEAKPAADEKPAEDKPAADKPAADKPADEKPADEKPAEKPE